MLRAWVACVMVFAAGCSSDADPRPQLVVVVDTDAPLPSQLADDPAISPEATVDTVRIDVLDGLEQVDGEAFAAFDARSWPISFGLLGDPGSSLRIRVRAFRAENSSFGLVDGEPVRDPDKSTSIDRLVELVMPTSGVEHVSVFLSFGCMGRPVQFSPESTCVDDEQPAAAFDAAVEPVTGLGGATKAGTHPFARDVPCSGEAPPGTVCIPGGFSLMGARMLVGISDGLSIDAAPLQPTYLAPFFMDRTEVDVERFRVVSAALTTPPPEQPDQRLVFCNWAPGTEYDLMPVNCVRWDTASEACALLGGALPSEAQWERAASGRGDDRPYPWGDAAPECCFTQVAWAVDCPGSDPILPVGSHADPQKCAGLVDETRDGVLDMAGNVSEWVADVPSDYGLDCWAAQGIRVDPVCVTAGTQRVFRGASAFGGLATTHVSWRRLSSASFATQGLGFRCVYPDAL